QETVEGLVAAEDRYVRGRREAGGEALGILEAAEVEGEDRQRPADRVEVRGDRRSELRHLGRLVAGGAVEGARVVVDAPHATEVDDLHLLLGLDGVLRLEVAEEQVLAVQISEGGEDLEHE